jgi:arsenite methyltransferase
MSMTSGSSRYFSQVAENWDAMRAEYFTEKVRQAAIEKAYLRQDFIVADIGAGTGFMSAGLAPLVKKVHVVDGSEEMLSVARGNLNGFDNLVYHEADGSSLPLLDESVDAVFANMYLHHSTDPQKAIREMVRILRPGGRLVITDLDAHTHEWMREEMADVWLGFERSQLYSWLREAGLVNLIIDCSGENCCAQSQKSEDLPSQQDRAEISVFVAAGTRRVGGARQAVQEHYGELAINSSSCCSPSQSEQSGCCGTDDLISIDSISDDGFPAGYSLEDQRIVPSEAADFSLGCGNPIAIANLRSGETVLDIGSGGGLDAFLSARQVGPGGKVIGVDMTDAMLERASRSAEKAGLSNVEFRKGQAEALPVEDGSVDVVISNCVINLCEDKGLVFDEIARVLGTGGRLEISDVVTDGSFPAEFRSNPKNWGGCVYGALPEREYLDLISQAGLTDIEVRRSPAFESNLGVKVYSIIVSARKN